MIRRLAGSLAVLYLVAVERPAAAGPSVEGARVLKGGRGEEVVVVILKPQAEGNAVLRFNGTTSPLDGMALPCKRSLDGHREYYSTRWRGRSFSFLQAELRDGERFELYTPGSLGRARALSVDAALTAALKPKEVMALHERQQKDGSLERFAAFHRDQEQAAQDKDYAEAAAATDKACGAHLPAAVAWDSVTDEALKQYSIASFCSPPLSALATLCARTTVAAAILRDQVKSVTCRFSAPMKLAVSGGKLEWTVDGSGSNADEFARKALEDLPVGAPIARSAGEAPPWGDGRTLGQQITLARSAVCTDGKSHFVVASPAAPSGPQLYYGDGKKLSRVRVVEVLGAGTFFEPRFVNPTANPDFRGADMRLFSSVEWDEDKRSCSARCGTRKSELQVLSPADAGALLAGASYGPPLEQHTAHSLTRDDRGSYYYVDKGSTPETARRFRLFVGPKGNLKLQQMTNVVSDSQGEIFSTRRGELRFIVGPKGSESSWVHGKTRIKLLAVPIEENWPLIYNELGVYLGEKRGTPCDDL